MLRCRLRYKKCIQPVTGGLIHGAHKLRQLRSHLPAIHQHLGMISVIARSNLPRKTALVNLPALRLKPNRKSLEARTTDTRHERHHRRRIHAARQERAHRHIRDHAQANCLLKQPAQLTARIFVIHRLAVRVSGGQVPILLHAHTASLPCERMPGQQCMHTGQHGVRRRHRIEGEIVVQCLQIKLAWCEPACQQALQLGGNCQPAHALGPVQRFDTQAVPRCKQLLFIYVPDCESKHAAQTLHALRTPAAIRGQHHLGIALRLKLFAAAFKLRSQLAKVVDLAVVHNHHPAVSGMHGHVTGRRKIDDGKARAGHRYGRTAIASPDAAVIRPAVVQAIGNPPAKRCICRANQCKDSAHQLFSTAGNECWARQACP